MLASIENLLLRFETQARHIKRSSSSGPTYGDPSSESKSSKATLDELEEEGRKAKEHLEDIATYMIDYSSIVKEWEEDVNKGKA
jgi:hypothetical protein